MILPFRHQEGGCKNGSAQLCAEQRPQISLDPKLRDSQKDAGDADEKTGHTDEKAGFLPYR